MSETYARSETMEDVPRMSATNTTASSPDSSNTSRNGQVTEEVEIGNVNVLVDEDDEAGCRDVEMPRCRDAEISRCQNVEL